jgi:broad specificity phosphatase PhoE
MRIRSVLIPSVLILFTACSSGENDSNRRDQMSQRERDSVLAESGIPGAKVVGQALTASDSETSHTSMVDSASQ